jgi:hypothetical protein
MMGVAICWNYKINYDIILASYNDCCDIVHWMTEVHQHSMCIFTYISAIKQNVTII